MECGFISAVSVSDGSHPFISLHQSLFPLSSSPAPSFAFISHQRSKVIAFNLIFFFFFFFFWLLPKNTGMQVKLVVLSQPCFPLWLQSSSFSFHAPPFHQPSNCSLVCFCSRPLFTLSWHCFSHSGSLYLSLLHSSLICSHNEVPLWEDQSRHLWQWYTSSGPSYLTQPSAYQGPDPSRLQHRWFTPLHWK